MLPEPVISCVSEIEILQGLRSARSRFILFWPDLIPDKTIQRRHGLYLRRIGTCSKRRKWRISISRLDDLLHQLFFYKVEPIKACQVLLDRMAQAFHSRFPQNVFGWPPGRWKSGRRGFEATEVGRREVNIRHYGTLGIQARLMMLASVTALPLVVLACVTAISLIDAQRMQLKYEVAGKVNGLLNDIDSQISAIQVELEVLSKLPSIQLGDLTAFDRQLRAAVQVYGTALVLHDTNGQQLINTNRPFSEPLPPANNTEMLDRVVATGRPQVSDLIIGATLRRPIISVGVPVVRDGHVV